MTGSVEIPQTPSFRLVNVRKPLPSALEGSEFALGELCIENGSICEHSNGPVVDACGRMILPSFVDMHTHLDKGHIWPRSPNPDGTFDSALAAVASDRTRNWAQHDVGRRMDFALRCAYAHGTSAIRTHLDSASPQHRISWPLFRQKRDEWDGRIALQASSILGIDAVEDEGEFVEIADEVGTSGGELGCVTYPIADLDRRLEIFFRMAADRGIGADFHTDETADPSSNTLRAIAETVIRTGFDAPVVVGHCCSIARQELDEASRTLDLVAEAGIRVVSLPMCNMYLQDRHGGRTPRWRGVTLVHEMRGRGIPVAFASDNTRDPFYAYGDLDMVEVMREATRICHLDHSEHNWLAAFTTTPASVCGFANRDLAAGETADFVIFNARNWTEFFARPQSDRIVVRNGLPISRNLPCYSELDDLMEEQ